MMCWFGLHKFGGFYLEREDGTFHRPMVYAVPHMGVLKVFKKCARCGKMYDQTWWGNMEQIKELRSSTPTANKEVN